MTRLLIVFVILLVILGVNLHNPSTAEAVAEPEPISIQEIQGPPVEDPRKTPTPNTEKFFKVGADSYSFLIKQYTNLEPKVKVVIYQDRVSLRKKAKEYNLSDTTTVAFVTRKIVDNKIECTIHTVDPYYSYEPEIVGHEFLHCVFGQWHIFNR